MFIKCSEAHGCSTLRDRRHTSLGRAVKPRRVVVGGQVTQRRLDEECDAPGTPFAVLNLAEKNQQVAPLAPTRHASILRRYRDKALQPLQWDQIFSDPSKPLVLDLGCGAGRSLLLAAHGDPSGRNYLGIEIRRQLAARANEWARLCGLSDRCHFTFGNASSSLRSLLAPYPGRLELAAIQFPDPPHKNRPYILQPELIQDVVDCLRPGGQLLIQSDVEEVARGMRQEVARHAAAAQHLRLAPQHRALGAATASGHPRDGEESDAVEAEWAAAGWLQLPQQPPSATSGTAAGAAGDYGTAAGAFDADGSGRGGRIHALQGCPTEREYWVQRGRRPVFRLLLVRAGVMCVPVS